ncbi:DUF1190 domain-containing protein [Enterovibrio baiacu]|uniref:DUF1190 domain-containing protein n=1 Tax=Enterovibrio baiacu TaxID=2491023 RepID=UPI0010105F92|nr:DUF1190 domain-containing protein [Enterovibrio baiacu]MBE1275187.1 DUF1190 domain-containing protein [Enterovibrio baiacu]
MTQQNTEQHANRPKRSSNVKRSAMNKAAKVIPFAFVGGISGCFFEPETEGFVFENPRQCGNSFPEQMEECEIAYQEALRDAAESAPRYYNQQECEMDFLDGCQRYSSFFIPALAGYFFARGLDDDYFKRKKKRYYSQPLYRYRGKFFSGDGKSYGNVANKAVNVSSSTINRKGGTVGQVMSRGGFGKSVSSSSRSSSRGG